MNKQSNYARLASEESLTKTIAALKTRGFNPIQVTTKEESLQKIKELIPNGATVMNGASVTLEQIGYKAYLASGNHTWVDMHAKIIAEPDEAKRHELRKQSTYSDYYLGSVHAVTEDGQMLIASNSGSQLPHIAFTSQHLIFVVSTKKIVTDFNAAMKRLEEYVVPLEDQRMMSSMGAHTQLNKMLIFRGDPPFLGRTIHTILVEEDLGF